MNVQEINDDNKMVCECGCGLIFRGNEGMGFQLKIGENLIVEKKLCGGHWSDYLDMENIHTWAELKAFLILEFETDKNSKVWNHLYPYTQINEYAYNLLPDSEVAVVFL